MPEAPIDPRQHYVYALFREDGATPFYIGMGKGKRWLQHEGLSRKRRTHKDYIIAGMLSIGLEVPKTKLAEGLTKAEAISIEMDLIYLIGRTPHGPLVNITKGGEGILDLSPDALTARSAKVAEANRRPEVNAKRSAKLKGYKFRPPTALERLQRSAKSKGNKNWEKMTPQQRQDALVRLAKSRSATHETMRKNREGKPKYKKPRQLKLILGYPRTETHRAKCREAMLAVWAGSDNKSRVVKMKMTMNSPETVAKLRVGRKKMWNEKRDKIVSALQAAWDDPIAAAQRREKLRLARAKAGQNTDPEKENDASHG